MSDETSILVDRMRREHVVARARDRVAKLKRELEDAQIALHLLELGNGMPRWKVNGHEVAGPEVAAPAPSNGATRKRRGRPPKALEWLGNEPAKLCVDCGDSEGRKPLSEFYANSESADGHQSRCKACDNANRSARSRGEHLSRRPNKRCKICCGTGRTEKNPDRCDACGLTYAEASP